MMMFKLRHALAAFALCLPCVTAALADDAQPTAETRIEEATLAAQAAIQMGPRNIDLSDQGVLKLPDGYGFIPRAEALALMDAQGNRSGGPGFFGMVVSQDLSGFVALEFTPVGHVMDEDAKNWNANDLLKNLREGTETTNADRRARGLPELNVLGWVEIPSYDPQTHRLVWSVSTQPKNTSSSTDGINYNTYVLGREGYFSVNLVTTLDRLELEKPAARELLAGLSFNPGKRYSDFNAATDRTAEYGLANLVEGSSAKKAGLLAATGGFVAKFWLLGLLAIAGGGLGAAKIMHRRKNSVA